MTTQSIQKLEDRVNGMIGKAYLVNAVTHKILSFRIDEEKLLIVSDKKWFPAIEVANSSKLLETFLETESEPETLPAQVIAQPVALQASGELKNIILENIRKVQADKEYIPQANEVGNQIKTLIDLAKTEIAYNRMVRGL